MYLVLFLDSTKFGRIVNFSFTKELLNESIKKKHFEHLMRSFKIFSEWSLFIFIQYEYFKSTTIWCESLGFCTNWFFRLRPVIPFLLPTTYESVFLF